MEKQWPPPPKIRANRLNAQRSTGPRTETGKQSTKLNALKHGLSARQLVLPGEEPEPLEALRAQLILDYAPGTEIECMLVEEIAQCWWRLQRARRHEVLSITASLDVRQPFVPKIVGGVQRYMTSIERAWHRSINQLRAHHDDRRKLASAGIASEPEQCTHVEAIGSVPQNQPQPAPPEPPPPPTPATAPLPRTAATPEPKNPFAPNFTDRLERLLETEIEALDHPAHTSAKRPWAAAASR